MFLYREQGKRCQEGKMEKGKMEKAGRRHEKPQKTAL